MAKKSKLPKAIKAWAGVVEGKIHGWYHMEQPYFEVYQSKAVARKNYEAVIPVRIVPVRKHTR